MTLVFPNPDEYLKPTLVRYFEARYGAKKRRPMAVQKNLLVISRILKLADGLSEADKAYVVAALTKEEDRDE